MDPLRDQQLKKLHGNPTSLRVKDLTGNRIILQSEFVFLFDQIQKQSSTISKVSAEGSSVCSVACCGAESSNIKLLV